MLIYALQVHLVPSLYTWINTEYVLHGAWISRTHTPVQSIQPLSETHSQIIHINGKWFIYVAPLIQGAFHRYSFTHSHTGGGGNHARHQPAHREQLGVQCLAQGHFDSKAPDTPGTFWATSTDNWNINELLDETLQRFSATSTDNTGKTPLS